MLAVDVSHWGGPLTDAEAQCLKDSGYSLVIANTWGPEFLGQMRTAHAHGLRCEAYVYLYLNRSPLARVRESLDRIEDLRREGVEVERLWLDYEDDPDGLAPHEIIAHAELAVETCGQFPCGIYTRASWWRPYTANSTLFADLPLWDAYYDERPADGWGGPYGGWTKALMFQFEGTTTVCGQSVDLNWREDEMSDQEKKELAIRRAQDVMIAELLAGNWQSVTNRLAYLAVRPTV